MAALGVAANHLADVLDGTHARATGQCRNGGELLDHFVDPLSFSYWVAGIASSGDCLLLGIGGVIVVYAMAVLTNIKAKMVGEFTLAQFGPTEFKSLLILFGLAVSCLSGGLGRPDLVPKFAFWFLAAMVVAGIIQLMTSLWLAVHEVNADGTPPDMTEWNINGKNG